MVRKILLGAALAGSVASPALATSNILFDPDGTGASGTYSISSFDWLPGNVLADAVLDASGTVDGAFSVYYQAALNSFVRGDTGRTLSPTGEFTVVAAFQEYVSGGTFNNRQFSLAPTQTNNFVEIYYDATPDSNDRTGFGFHGNEGTGALNTGSQLVFRGTVSDLSGVSSFTFATGIGTDANGNGIGDATGDAWALPNDPNIPGPFVANFLDKFNTNNYPTVGSVVGSGATDLIVTPTYLNTDFFKTSPVSLIIDMFTNTSLVDPFRQTDPSAQFWTGAGGYTTPNYSPNISTFLGAPAQAAFAPITKMNGGPVALNDTGTYDFHFQADGTSSFDVVPEPGTMVLLGSGLLGLAGVGRRRMKNQA